MELTILFSFAVYSVALATNYVEASTVLPGIPTAPFVGENGEGYPLQNVKSILVHADYANAVDDRGQTLIPPTLHEFAKTFADDLQTTLEIQADVILGNQPCKNSIFLTLDESGDYFDAAGRTTSEGYSLNVSRSGIVISGASPLGTWWGTRTVLQQAILNNKSIIYGSGSDAPGWATRGMMLDAGRHFYPKDFLIEMCSYMSFFKQNTFQVHVSDNLYNNPNYTREQSLNLHARFRLWSDDEAVSGLNKYRNESYTKADFEEIQRACASRGVTILPEIEAPGHALVIVQWKPELGLSTDLSLLNISVPETIPTMQTIWKTFLPWFHTKIVSIGADEYTSSVLEYNRFVNAMADYIAEESGKSIRIWGTFPPNATTKNDDVYKNISIQHWEYFEDDPYYDYILNNYSVLNSDDAFYTVNKWSNSYPQEINLTRTFHGNPNGGYWYPYIFDMTNKTENPKRSEPLVLGSIVPQWNDYGQNTSVISEAYYVWRDGIPALADKQWGGSLSESDYNSVFSALHSFIPGQNLERKIPSKAPLIFNYSFPMCMRDQVGTITDLSGNGYDACTDCGVSDGSSLSINSACSITTPVSSKGRNYTLSFSIKVDELEDQTNATLIAGWDSNLMLTPNITLFASGNYYRLNASLPLETWVDLSLVARGNRTFAVVQEADAQGPLPPLEHEFLTQIGVNGEYFVWAPMAIEAPLRTTGGPGCGWKGEIRSLSLSSEASTME